MTGVQTCALPISGAAAGAANSAVCTALTGYDTVAAAAPQFTAETPAADVRAFNDQLQAAGTALTSAAGDLDVSGVANSLAAFGTAVTNLAGDTVGDAAEGLNAAFTGVTDAFGGVRTAAACS